MKKVLFTIAICITMIIQTVAATTISVVSTSGNLSDSIISAGGNLDSITNLTVTGTIDARDFKLMRDSMPLLADIDLSGANITFYSGTKGTWIILNSMDYPANSIPLWAFKDCSHLTSIIIPSSVNRIWDYAFEGCTGLTSVNISEGLIYIEQGAFENCTGLTSVTIPSSVISIGGDVFGGCSGLTSINVYNPVPVDLTLSNVFYNVNKTSCVLHVPTGTKTAYQAAAQWQDFLNIVEDLPAAVKNTTTSNINVSVQNGMLSIESKTQAINSVKLITMTGSTVYEDAPVKSNLYTKQINYTGILICVVSLENGEVVTKKILDK